MMPREILEKQALTLLAKLSHLVDSECVGWKAIFTSSVKKEKLIRVRANAYVRILRRQHKIMP
jgi:hypothetical protein